MFDVFEKAELKAFSATPTVKSNIRAAERVLTRENFATAVDEITSWEGYQVSPLHHLTALAKALGVAGILYKDEAERFGLGSFKALGGAYAGLRVIQRELTNRLSREISMAEIRSGTLAQEVSKITLVSATDGNHGRSLSWGAAMFGVPCRIYIHAEVSEGREKAMQELGATVVRIAGDYDDSVRLAREEADANNWFVVSDTSWSGYSQPPKDVMSGYGVMIHEITQQIDTAPTHVFVQGGVGGLAAGVAAGLRQHWSDNTPRFIVVEPELADCLFQSAQNQQQTAVQIEQETIMAGLSCGEPSPLAWDILEEEVSDYLTIPDSIVAPTMRLCARPLENDPAITAGESAVAGLAAFIAAVRDPALKTKIGLNSKSRVLFIGSEGATDPEIYDQLVNS
jgi:diaminopropionate ammonia-lyase